MRRFGLKYFVRNALLAASLCAGALGFASQDGNAAPRISATSWQEIPNGSARFLKFDSSPIDELPGITHGLELKLAPEWHSYWLNPGDSGAAPIILAAKGAQEQELKIHYALPMRIEMPPLSTYGYEGSVLYFFEVPEEILNGSYTLIADILVCKIECIPGIVESELEDFIELGESEQSDTWSLTLEKAAQIPLEQFAGSASYSGGATQSTWRISLGPEQQALDLFWLPEQVQSLQRPAFVVDGEELFFYSEDVFAADTGARRALLTFEDSTNGQPTLHAQWIEFTQQVPKVWPYLFWAFIGGLILNVMPCVFPIISLKAFAIAQSSGKSSGHVRRENLAYSLGVVLSFWLMAGILVLIRESGQVVGWGFQMQNPWFVGSLCALFVVLALSFFDVWSWNWIPAFAAKPLGGANEGSVASFFSGLLAVLVASPCTAPFMGAALGFALGQSLGVILVIFTGLGVGMAFPFLLFSAAPAMARLLPKPGAWMVSFKKLMGVMLLATAGWLGWIQHSLLAGPGASSANWTALDAEGWTAMTQQTQPRFINFTADWCVTCQVNERVVFQRVDTQAYFQERGVELYKVDWTQREEAIAKKITSFGRAGVPLYLYFSSNSVTPILLPELLSLDLLKEKIEAAEGN